jgi:hypothetical protein
MPPRSRQKPKSSAAKVVAPIGQESNNDQGDQESLIGAPKEQPKASDPKPAAVIAQEQNNGQGEQEPLIGAPKEPPKCVTAEPAKVGTDQEQNNDQRESLIVTVTSKVEGFRRAGRAWSKSPTTILASEFSNEQLVQIAAEPMLEVVVVEKEAE